MNPALRRSSAHVFVESLDHPFLSPEDHHHLLRVLRLRDGEPVSVSDGMGGWRLCRLTASGELITESDTATTSPPMRPTTVGFAIPKGDRPEWIVQKLTEIGVDRIVLLHAERSIVRWDAGKIERQLDRLNKVAREAAMQSRRVRLVELCAPVSVGLLLADMGERSGSSTGIALAEPGGGELTAATSTVLIGPEGGWTDAELDLVPRRVALGETILRVETAAVVAGSYLVAKS